ncbi:mechanosensitive ion channel family protein [Pontibacillus litoralis]|uniref:Mechanosensitive ion channel protein MscS n=1 Tax=Pontibacillus litoralis JSM 072002 TaxID=1385512 RepID=A0A0A5GAD9_9BACI|nr:mechanosensitive ion channel family protein [Pontibacillus litoralis]KGX88163.1 mechanosensitive ion channel protein MscS [Pontibacillus litoralis JSM 072002]
MDFIFLTDWWTFLTKLLSNTLVRIIIAGIFFYIGTKFIQRSIRSFFKRTSFIDEKKEKTMEAMLRSLIYYTATFGYIIFILLEFDVPITKMLAGAGVLGIIIGFGAQSLIRDLLAGVFFLYENQLNKGDFVAINNTHFGTVEDIGLRFLKVREWSGKLLTISNGLVNTIHNYNIDHMRVIEKITISYYEDPQRVLTLLEDICRQLNEELEPYLKQDAWNRPVQPFQVYGMTSLNNEHRGYEYTIIGLTDDIGYWTASIKTRHIIANRLYEEQIQMSLQHIDFPHHSANERMTKS